MAITITGRAGVAPYVQSGYLDNALTPSCYANIQQYGSPTTWKSHAITSTSLISTGVVQVNMDSVSSSGYTLIAQATRLTAGATITCRDANVSIGNQSSFNIRTTNSTGTSVNFTKSNVMVYDSGSIL